MANKYLPLEVRFFSKVNKTESCWIWSGARSSKRRGGHERGQISINGKLTFVHRASWLIHYGPIPSGLLVCHSCDTPLCVNPSHLFLGTQKDNMKDCAAKGRVAGQGQLSEACYRGHIRTSENTYIGKQGWRHCRTCWKITAAENHKKKMREKAELREWEAGGKD